MRKLEYTIPKEYSKRPLLHFLRGSLKLSTHIVQALRHTENSVFVNGKFSRVIDKVFEGDKLEIYLPEKTTPPKLWEKEIDIIYEDEDLLIINKPSGVSSHPTINHQNFTLANAVANYLVKTNNTPSAARAIGRLDKVTSGVIIFAKNSFAASKLNGNIEKIYNAIVYGEIETEGTIDAPIFRPDINKTKRAVDERGDRAVTHFKRIAQLESEAFLEVQIETGRTHQIRVHLSHIGHALVGDDMYGGPLTDNMKRAALHCKKVRLLHPVKNEYMEFEAPLPNDMKKELEKNGFFVDKYTNIC